MISKLRYVGIILVLLCGCEPDGNYTQYTSTDDPLQVRAGVVYSNDNEGTLELLRVTPKSISLSPIFELREGEVLQDYFTGPDGADAEQLFALTYGEDARRIDVYPCLSVINATTRDTTRYPIGSVFQNYRFSPDGATIILYHGANDVSPYGGLNNPNEIAVIDVTSPPSAANPRIEAINIAGHTISDIRFLDEMVLGSVSRKLVAFITEGAIQFTDFNQPQLSSIVVALKNDTDQRQIVANKFLQFPATALRGPRVFVRAQNATEIYDIEFHTKNNAIGFYATTSLLDGGAIPSDFALLEDDGELFVVSASVNQQRINIFEASTARTTTIATQDRIHTIFPRIQNGQTELVMIGVDSHQLYFLASQGLKEQMGDNLETLSVPAGIHNATVLDNDRLLISPNGGGLIVADLRSRIITHLSGQNSTTWNEHILFDNTLFLPRNRTVHFLNILQGSPGALALDELISDFFVFPKQGIGVAIHPAPTGRATVFPLSEPVRARCQVFDGYQTAGILNRGEK